MSKRFRRKGALGSQAGFTLVEIAIVMVIIGLLIGGILKGQELIKNAKMKRVMKQADELRVAATSYQDRYAFLPGDDSQASTRWAGVPNGGGNGQITGAEVGRVFIHLSSAGFISGTYDGTPATYPRNPFGGQYQVQYVSVGGRAIHWFRSFDIPGEIGQMLDTTYDDGVWNTGSMISSADYATANVVTLNIEF